MKASVLLISIILSIGISFGQNSRLEISQMGVFSSEDKGQAKVFINQDSQLKEIMISKAQATREVSIWRVQIYLGSEKNSRAVASSVLSNFKSKYPDFNGELLYHSPYFKVQVGNFKTRLEAESFKRKIQADYKSLWVVSEVYKVN